MAIETEAEWLVCRHPLEVAEYAVGRVEQYRFRWLLASWAVKIDEYHNERDRPVLDAFLRSACGLAPPPRAPTDEWLRYARIRYPMHKFKADDCIRHLRTGNLILAAANASLCACEDFPGLFTEFEFEEPTDEQRADHSAREDAHFDNVLRQFCDEFRDVAGNPFRPVAFDPAWRTETVVGLAVGIDETGAYERLPILADALEEAGCTDAQVLSHAREPGVHVRGCWLIDMVLGRW